MRYLFGFLCVCALGLVPLVGCGSSEPEAEIRGPGGSGGAGGMAGTRGSEPSPVGLWTGSGQGGADGSFTICFNVREDGLALVPPLDASPECYNHSFEIEFDVCEGALLVGGGGVNIPIVDGVFHLLEEGTGPLAGYWDIIGTFDGNTASGEAIVGAVDGGTCSASWEATPSP